MKIKTLHVVYCQDCKENFEAHMKVSIDNGEKDTSDKEKTYELTVGDTINANDGIYEAEDVHCPLCQRPFKLFAYIKNKTFRGAWAEMNKSDKS